jgi:hypothetical protein
MSFDVSALPAYTEQNAMDLIVESVAKGKLAEFANIQDGVKGPTTINILDTDVVFQADGCSRSASGSTALSQRTITPGAIAIHEDLCMSDLAAKYTAVMLKQGLTNEKEEIPFAELYFNLKIAKLKKAIEVADWQGDTTSGNANLSKYDGLNKIIDAAGTAVAGNSSGTTVATGITASAIGAAGCVLDLMTDMVAAIPEDIQDADDLKLFCGMDTFLKYQQSIFLNNMFHYTSEGQTDRMPLVGFPNVEVVATPGLSGTNRMFLLRASNIYIGVDLNDEESSDVRSWFDLNDRIYKVSMAFRRGVNVAFPDEIVQFTLA